MKKTLCEPRGENGHGVPALRPLIGEKIGKALVLFPGALGDFVCFLPALETLASEREVELWARTEYADLAPCGVTVRSIERYEISRLFVPGAEGEEGLRDFFAGYGGVYSWMGSSRPDFVGRLKALSRGRLQIFPFRPDGSRMHMIDYYLSCLGVKAEGTAFPTIPAPGVAVLEWRDRFWQKNGLGPKQVLVIAPGSGAREKNWPLSHFRAVGEWWEKRVGGRVIVLWGPVERERGTRAATDDWALGLSGLGLAEVAAVLGRCDLYLGNDSGITHLAAALGVQTAALFGPSSPEQWAPRGKRVKVISQGMECSPCAGPVMKSCPHRKCLTTLSPEMVIRHLERILRRGARLGR